MSDQKINWHDPPMSRPDERDAAVGTCSQSNGALTSAIAQMAYRLCA